MEKIKATFRVVTPMFVSGADQSRAELRLPSIKGVLRFWWRALAWGRFNGDLDKIRGEEAKLFGSTDTGQAAVLMKLETLDPLKDFIGEQRASEWSQNGWQNYVGYGLVDRKDRPTRQYIKPGFEFRLHMIAKTGEQLLAVESSLKALGLLGGLGGRSRKGWGSLTLQNLEGVAEWQAPHSTAELKHELERLLRSQRSPGPYTGVSSEASFAIGEVRTDAASAQKTLAQDYREFLKTLTGQKKKTREAFGLPRQLQMRGENFENAQKRRASPVFLHIHQFPNNQAIPIVSMLPGVFLETQPLPTGNWKYARDFLSSLDAIEVKI